MKKLIYLLIVSFLFLSYSCKKTNKSAQAGEYIPKINYPQIKLLIDSTNSDSISFLYNSEGKLIAETNNTSVVDLVYETNKVIVNYYNNSALLGNDIYYINLLGLASKVVHTDFTKKTKKYNFLDLLNNKNSKALTDTTYYFYDHNKYVIKEINNYSTTLKEYQNGNLSKSITDSDTINYYHLNNTNTIGHQNFGIEFLGKQDAKLIDYLEYKTSNQFQRENYSYEYDNNGRVIKMRIHSSVIQTFIFEYNN